MDLYLAYKANGDIDVALPSLDKAKGYLDFVVDRDGHEWLGEWEIVMSDRHGPKRWVRSMLGKAEDGFEGPELAIYRIEFLSGSDA